MLFCIVLQPPGITNTASNCYASSVLQCLMNHLVFFRIPAINQQTYTLWMYKVRYIYIYCKFKVQKIQIITNLCCHTGLCLLKVLLNLYSIHRYNSDTTTLVQTLSSKREKYNKYQSLLLKTDVYESFVPGRYQDTHEYSTFILQLITQADLSYYM